MKKVLLFLFVTMFLVLAACEKKSKIDLSSSIIGDWELVDFEPSTKSIIIGDQQVTVFLSLVAEDNMFYLRQNIGEGHLQTFYGKWSLSGKILTGEYYDKTPWGESYTVSMTDENTLVLTTSEEIGRASCRERV